MALFKKKDKEPQPPAKKKAAGGGGVLGALGVKTEPAPTEEDKRDAEREEKTKRAWQYLRGRIDNAIHDYYRTGQFTAVEKYVERPALDALKQELYTLRSANILWQQPDRKAITEPQLTVVDIELNRRGQPIKFTIRERFRDFSVHQRVVDSQLVPESRCDGAERVIEAVVTVKNGSEYRLHSVRQVKSATLG